MGGCDTQIIKVLIETHCKKKKRKICDNRGKISAAVVSRTFTVKKEIVATF